MYPFSSVIPIDRNCKCCPLSNEAAVSGNGPEDLAQIRAILISDYPGAYETEFSWPQVPNDWVAAQRDRQPKLPQRPNSGAFIRKILEEFGYNTYKQVWMTNAFKCDPSSGAKSIKPTRAHLGTCAATWLKAEFYRLDLVVPKVPIIAAGSWALKAMRLVYPDTVPNLSVDKLLRSESSYAGEHPLIVTYNPATYARSYGYIETNVRVMRRTGRLEIANIAPLENQLFTPSQIYRGDLARLNTCLPRL